MAPPRPRSNRRPNRRRIPISFPPPAINTTLAPIINTTKSRFQTIRYAASVTNANSVYITRGSVLSTCVMTASAGATIAIPVYTAVRIRGVKIMLTPSASATTDASITFQWLSDLGTEKRYLFTALGSLGFRSPYLSPPPRSRAGMWSRANSLAATLEEILFDLNVNGDNANSAFMFLDVDFEFISDSDSTASITTSANATSNGGIFYVPLDNQTTGAVVGSWKLAPVGLDLLFNSAPATYTRSG